MPTNETEATLKQGDGPFMINRKSFRIPPFHAALEHDGWRIDRNSFKLAGDAVAVNMITQLAR